MEKATKAENNVKELFSKLSEKTWKVMHQHHHHHHHHYHHHYHLELSIKHTEKAQKNKEIVLAALEQDAMSLQFAGGDFNSQFKLVLGLVSRNGLALEFADKDLRADRDVVFAAVKQNPRALALADAEAAEAAAARRELPGLRWW